MASSRRSPKPRTGSAPAPDVETFLTSLEHPQKPALLALRRLIRDADPAVGESVKWNAPSFHTSKHFATFQLRHRGGVQVVLHFGGKPRRDVTARTRVADPAGLLEWRGPNRATATFADLADVKAKREPFGAVLRQWITLVE
jgi:hypothetical protein